MRNTYTYDNVTWIDLERPTREEIVEITKTYDIHPFIEKELSSTSLKPKVESYDNSLYTILHFPALKHGHPQEEAQEVDFIIGKDFIITVRYDSVDALADFAKAFEAKSITDKKFKIIEPGAIFIQMILRLYRAVDEEIDILNGSLEHIKKQIFNEKERDMVIAISHADRGLLNLEKGLLFHEEILESLGRTGEHYMGKDFIVSLHSVREMQRNIKRSLEQTGRYLGELRKTNDSLLSLKQNEIMRVFTVMAFIIFPLSLLTDILTIQSPSNPLYGIQNDFWIITGIVVFVGLFMYLFFKGKRWL
ncbi:MAG: CorA family divalent cation transporter [Candidatus Pacebacteria bacterium]|nr:CorA family divalent cation transporter [Candidatus Paceibacterota bacterium]